MDEAFHTNGTGVATARSMAAIAPKTNVTDFPLPEPMEVPDDAPIPFWKRQLYYGGFLTMAGSQPKPPGFYVNIQTATFLLVVLGAIAGLWAYTKDTYLKQGYQLRQIEELEQKVKDTDTKAEDARKAAYVNQSETDPTPMPKENKKNGSAK